MMMKKQALAIQVAVALAASSGTVIAQERSGFTLEEVVVTAQKRAESSQDVPISIQAFSNDAMEKLGATELMDLSKSAPSFSIGGIPGSQQTSGLRGIVDYGRNIGIDGRMGVYIDGVFQGRSATANQPLLGLESVEILRGPQGTLFGKNTVSGAINLNTRKADEEFTGEIKAGVGNEGQWSAAGLISGALSDNVFGSVAYSRQEYDGWFDSITLNKTLGDRKQEGARAQLRFLPNDQLEIILAGDYGLADSNAPVFTNIELPAYKTTKGKERDKVESWGSALTLNYSTASDYTLTSISAYRDNEYTLSGDEDFSALVDAYQTFFDEDGDQFSQEIRIVSPQHEKYDWVAGLYYFESSTSTSRNISFAPPIVPVDQLSGNIAIPSSIDVTDYAAYFHGNYRITEQWEVTAGLRFTDVEKDFDFNQVNAPTDEAGAAFVLQNILGFPPPVAAFVASQVPGALFGAFNLDYKDKYEDSFWTPTVGLNFMPNDDVMYYAKYSRGYQSGGFNGDFNPYLPAIEFDSEYVDAYEIGVKSTLADGTLRLNADVFVQKYSDFQLFQRIPVNNTSVQIVSNAGEATSQGVELETVWLPTDTLQLTFNATYLDATYDKFDNPVAAIDPTQPENFDGNDLNFAPEWRLYAGLQYIQALGDNGDLTFNLDYTYQDDSYSNSPNNDEFELIPDYDLWNARVTFNPASYRWQLSAWIKNIGDDEYLVNHSQASITLVNRSLWGMPRLYGVEFKYLLGH